MDKDELLEYAEENDLDLPKKAKKLTAKKLRAAVVDAYEEAHEDDDKKEDKKGKDKKGSDDDEVDLEELKEELEDMDKDELKEWLEEHDDVEIETKVTKKNLEDCIEEIMEAMEEKPKKDKKDKKGKKDKKEKKEKKSKKEKGDKDEKLPKGLRSGTLPATIYEAIADGGATLGQVAKIVSKIKKKEPERVRGLALRTIIRKVSDSVPITALIKGDEDSIFFEVAEEE